MTTPRGPRNSDFSIMDTGLNVEPPKGEPGGGYDIGALPMEFGKDPLGVLPKGGNKPTGPSGDGNGGR